MSQTFEIPLPRRIRDLVANNDYRLAANPGLLLDKYVASWSSKEQGGGDFAKDVQRPTLQHLIDASEPGEKNFNDVRTAWSEMMEALRHTCGGEMLSLTTTSPLAIHLSRASGLENAGICLHPIYGFVYLPGSGLKGLAHAYACEVWLPAEPDKKAAFSVICGVFGYAPSPGLKSLTKRLAEKFGGRPEDYLPSSWRKTLNEQSKVEKMKSAHAGSIVFHDAWPTAKPEIMLDIVNCHHPEYYSKGEPPGDWENPIPVNFPVVKPETKFEFPLTKRRTDVSDEDLKLAKEWLIGGLVELGCGAKTAAGYGYFKLPKDTQLKRESHIIDLQLETPAFLGGADHHAEPTLRLGSMKASLRFWFRAWQGHLETADLLQREKAVFGLLGSGSRLEIQPEPSPASSLKLMPSGTAMGQGGAPLGYMGYGPIQYKKAPIKANVTQYDAIEAGQQLTFRVCTKDSVEMTNVWKSLWLWCALGGIGSRSRRGWGSIRLTSTPPDSLGLPSLDACTNRDDYMTQLRIGLEMLAPKEARKHPRDVQWTALSTHTRIELSAHGFSSSREALEDLGGLFQKYRGRDKRGGTEVGPDYVSTKLLLQNNLNRDTVSPDDVPTSLPERSAFGMPYMQAYTSLRREPHSKSPTATFTPQWPGADGKKMETGRRASPLLCKVVKLQASDNKPYYWQVAYLPAQFLPANATVKAERTDVAPKSSRDGVQNYPALANSPFPPPGPLGVARMADGGTLLDDFLDWLSSEANATPPTPSSAHAAWSPDGKRLPPGGQDIKVIQGASKMSRGTRVTLKITGEEQKTKTGTRYWPVTPINDTKKAGKLLGDPPSEVTPHLDLQIEAYVLDDNPGNRQYVWVLSKQ